MLAQTRAVQARVDRKFEGVAPPRSSGTSWQHRWLQSGRERIAQTWPGAIPSWRASGIHRAIDPSRRRRSRLGRTNECGGAAPSIRLTSGGPLPSTAWPGPAAPCAPGGSRRRARRSPPCRPSSRENGIQLRMETSGRATCVQPRIAGCAGAAWQIAATSGMRRWAAEALGSAAPIVLGGASLRGPHSRTDSR